MARINIEEKLFVDARFKALARKVGNEDQAIGMMVRAFQLGQRYWGKNKSLIPIAEWKLANLEMVSDCLLAEQIGNEIYIKGSNENFEWYFKKVEASKKGVTARAQIMSKMQPIDQPIGQPIGQPMVVNPPTPTPTPTPIQNSNSLNSTNDGFRQSLEQAQPKKRSSASKLDKKPSSMRVWQAYEEAYEKRYLIKPVRNARESTLCTRLMSMVGEECAIDLARFYLSGEDRYYCSKFHPLSLLLQDCQKIRTIMIRLSSPDD